MADPTEQQLMELIRTERDSHPVAVPSPAMIWWRAQLIEKRRKQERALLPTRFIRAISVVAIYAAVAAVLYIAATTGTIPSSLLWFTGLLFLSMFAASAYVYWGISSDRR